jgi:hypothetical protein
VEVEQFGMPKLSQIQGIESRDTSSTIEMAINMRYAAGGVRIRIYDDL